MGVSVRTLWSSLRFRVLSYVIGIALVCLLAAVYSLHAFQRQQLIEYARVSNLAMTNLIEANLHHAMLSDNWGMINDIIAVAIKDNSVDMVRILTTEGRVVASSRHEEVGKTFGLDGPLCQQCHNGGNIPTDFVGAAATISGEQALFSINLISSEPQCWTCHNPNQKILGLLLVETPLTIVDRQLAAGFWRTSLLALIACGLMVGLLVPVLNKYVIRPVEVLSRGVDELTTGNLDYEVNPLNQDELGKLAESFDHMRLQLKNSYLEIAQRESEAVSLYQMGIKISASQSLAGLLDCVAEAARELLKADIGLVGLFDDKAQAIIFEAASGVRAEAHRGMRMPVSPGTPGHALLEGRPVLAEAYDQNNLLHPDNSLIASERVVSILAVPLRLSGRFLGVIEVMSRDHRQFSQADGQLLMRLAHTAFISIENAQLYNQLHYLSTLEERDRLAREMHDDLAQVLGYLNVRAAMTDDLLSDGNISEAKISLTELKRAAKRAYTDVREEIFNLRTSISPGVGLVQTLRDYLADYHTHYGLETKLICECDTPDFPAEVSSQLLRIIQEALANVRKHACASLVCVRFSQEGNRIRVQVEDNGQGFYPDQSKETNSQSYGLQIMRERAESIGGGLELESKPGHGTSVNVSLPAYSAARRKS